MKAKNNDMNPYNQACGADNTKPTKGKNKVTRVKENQFTIIRKLIRDGALFVVNHSGGKDSQYQLTRLIRIIPREQLVIVHATLGRFEWEGVIEHIESNSYGLPVIVCKNKNKDFLQMVNNRGMFPDKSRRQCTSDLKRDPISSAIIGHLKSIGKDKIPHIVVNCTGIRGEESTGRSILNEFTRSNRFSTKLRTWFEWMPIHTKKIEQVKQGVKDAGQELHWAYGAGMSRLSCCFCIMANQSDLMVAAGLMPELYKEYVLTERKLNHTLQMSGKTLEEITGIKID